MAEVKKIKKRIRRNSGKKRNMYFNKDTAAAIEAYQKSENAKEREELYAKEIFPAFDKLAENLIVIHRFQGLHDSYDDLKNDCVTFLYEVINKFDPARGSEAFSYFNVVAKNWLIIRSKQRSTKIKRSISIDDHELLSHRDNERIENYQVLPSQDDQFQEVEFIAGIYRLLDEIKDRICSENEKICISAVSHIFKNIDKMDLLNKRAIFMHIRDISSLSPKQLTTAIANIKKHYKELKNSEDFGIY